MISSRSILLPLLLSSTTTAISLNNFQQITGFTPTCTLAYSGQIPNCGTNDFSNGNACSTICISSLQVLMGAIQTACAGQKATQDTLIGKVFAGQGVTTLCPNAASQGGGGTGQTTIFQTSIGQSTQATSTPIASTSSTSAIVVSSIPPPSSSTSTSSSTEPTSLSIPSSSTDSTSSSSSSTSTSESPSSFDPSVTAAPSTSTSTSTSDSSSASASSSSADSNNNSNSKSSKGFTTTAFNNGQATTITSQAQRTGSSNPDAFGGGGSPFEVGDNGTSGAGSSTVGWTLLVVIVGFVQVLL